MKNLIELKELNEKQKQEEEQLKDLNFKSISFEEYEAIIKESATKFFFSLSSYGYSIKYFNEKDELILIGFFSKNTETRLYYSR